MISLTRMQCRCLLSKPYSSIEAGHPRCQIWDRGGSSNCLSTIQYYQEWADCAEDERRIKAPLSKQPPPHSGPNAGTSVTADQHSRASSPTHSGAKPGGQAAATCSYTLPSHTFMFRMGTKYRRGTKEGPDFPPDEAVPGLVLTHIASGATRAVRAPWMHHLYSQVLDEMNTTGTRRSKGVTFYIEEAGYSSQITFPHYVVVAILLVQLLVGVYAVSRGCQFREGLLILTGLVIRIAEGVLARQFPFYEPPRAWTKETKYALHTGMTTTHLVLVSHRPKRRPDAVNVLGHGINLDHKHINLEDTAAPMRRTAHGRQKFLEKACCTSLFLATWAQKSIGLLYPANGYLYAVTLMVGSVAMEVITIMCPLLPRHSELIPLQLEDGPRANMLDALAAACQSTNSVSVGFVEAILPDRHGNHTDYHYINRILTSDIESLRRQPHPSHPWSDTIHKAALRRRPAGQVSQPGVSSVSFGHNSTTISQG